MKAILEFSLPEEKEDFQNACSANKMKVALISFFEKLRHIEKYESDNYNKSQLELVCQLKQDFLEELQELKIDLYD